MTAKYVIFSRKFRGLDMQMTSVSVFILALIAFILNERHVSSFQESKKKAKVALNPTKAWGIYKSICHQS